MSRPGMKPRTAMDDVILMTIFECRADLASKLAGNTFTESAVADDVVEHLAAIDELEDDVVVI